MRRSKSPRLRGSVTQNNISVRMRARGEDGPGILTRLGILGVAALILVAILAGLWQAGLPQREAARFGDWTLALTQQAHFAIGDVEITGRHMSSDAALTDALGAKRGAPILAFDPAAAAARIGNLPWVDSAVVERRLPGTVAVLLTERVPAARWQRDDRLYVIDQHGRVIAAADADNFGSLPLLVGEGADSASADFLAVLAHYPEIEKRLTASVRVGERRWDLHLAPGIAVKLPENDAGGALNRLSVLIAQEKILDRNIASIDLRMPDRLVIDPAPAAKTGAAHL